MMLGWRSASLRAGLRQSGLDTQPLRRLGVCPFLIGLV